MLGLSSPKKSATAKIQMDKRRAMMTLGFSLNQKFEKTTLQGNIFEPLLAVFGKAKNLVKITLPYLIFLKRT